MTNKTTEAMRSRARDHLSEATEVNRRVRETGLDAIMAAAELVAETLRSGGKLLLCGNGGSAADCQHLAAEFVSRLSRDFERRALPAVALTTDSSILTAVGNDCGFDRVFSRQVEALGRKGDLLIGISTSGGSANVVEAFAAARTAGMRTLALTGQGGSLAAMADAVVAAPSVNTQHVQEMHLAIEHILCDLVECLLFGNAHPSQQRR